MRQDPVLCFPRSRKHPAQCVGWAARAAAQPVLHRLPTPLRVLGTLLHMHTTGKSITLRHFDRAGTELAPLGHRSSWDFDFQPWGGVFPSTQVLAPGDTLVTSCAFDTRSRDTTTRWGFGSDDEMCFAFLMVYEDLELAGEWLAEHGPGASAFVDPPSTTTSWTVFNNSDPNERWTICNDVGTPSRYRSLSDAFGLTSSEDAAGILTACFSDSSFADDIEGSLDGSLKYVLEGKLIPKQMSPAFVHDTWEQCSSELEY